MPRYYLRIEKGPQPPCDMHDYIFQTNLTRWFHGIITEDLDLCLRAMSQELDRIEETLADREEDVIVYREGPYYLSVADRPENPLDEIHYVWKREDDESPVVEVYFHELRNPENSLLQTLHRMFSPIQKMRAFFKGLK